MKLKLASLIVSAIGACTALSANATTWYWTGAGGDLNWFTAANWNDAADGTGNAPTAETPLASGDSFTFDAVTPSGDVNYNPSGDFNITTVTFGTGLTATVKITGAKITSLGNAVNNNTSYGMEFANEVQFSSTINLTVPTKKIVMSGGATGTEPANHIWFFGKYTLTATTWSIKAAYHLADGGRLVCNNLVNYDGSSASTGISAGEGAEFIVNGNYTIQHDAPGASYNVVSGRNHKGLLWVKGKILPTVNNSVKTFRLAPNNSLDWDFSGRIKAGGIDIQLKKEKSVAYFNPSVSSPCYLALGKDGLTRYGTTVTLYFKNDFVIRCYDDWSLAGQITGIHPTDAGDPYNNNIVFDTSDCDDPSVGHTVTINNRISGARQVAATGCGKIIWRIGSNYSNMFTGGFVASNGVTVALRTGRSRHWFSYDEARNDPCRGKFDHGRRSRRKQRHGDIRAGHHAGAQFHKRCHSSGSRVHRNVQACASRRRAGSAQSEDYCCRWIELRFRHGVCDNHRRQVPGGCGFKRQGRSLGRLRIVGYAFRQ